MSDQRSPEDDGPESSVPSGDRKDCEDRSSASAGTTASERSASDDGEQFSPESLSNNLVFAAVDNPRRRLILEALQAEGGEADIDQLVDDLVSIGQRADAVNVEEDHERVLEEVYDDELPDLSDIGVVDLDEFEGTVSLGPYADELDVDGFHGDVETEE